MLTTLPVETTSTPARTRATLRRSTFWGVKRALDLLASFHLLPLLALVAFALVLLNPLLNPGPLIFAQRRMGRGGKPFVILKFRTMMPTADACRRPGDPVERARITPLGRRLRRLRIDELPQVINVLRGEMSLIGPRPEILDHALDFSRIVPGYWHRHSVRPGISGYAQVRLGYTEGHAGAAAKTQLDLHYIHNTRWRLELAIALATLRVIISGFGAR